MRSLVSAAIILIIAAMGSAREWNRKAAQQAFDEARRLHLALEQTAAPKASRDNYLECIRKYQQVYLTDPHFGGSDDAVFQAGRLYQEMGRIFGSPEYAKTAVTLFHFLISEYSESRHCPEARQRIDTLTLARTSTARERPVQLSTVLKTSEPAGNIPVKRNLNEEAALDSSGRRSTESNVLSSIRSIRHWSTRDYTRVAIDMDTEARYQRIFLPNPDRLCFDISGARLSPELGNTNFVVNDEVLKQIRIGQNRFDMVRVVLDFAELSGYTVFELHDPFRIIIDIIASRHANAESKQVAGASSSKIRELIPSRNAAPASSPARPSVRLDANKQNGSELAADRQTSPVLGQQQTGPGPGAIASEQSALNGSTKTTRSGGSRSQSSVIGPLQVSKSDSSEGVRGRQEPTVVGAKRVSNSSPQLVRDNRPPALAASKNMEKTATADIPKPTLSVEPVLAPKVAAPTGKGDRTLTRVLGLKIGRIVLDAGHGGHDTGTIGHNGLKEKDLVLEVAHQLQRLLEERLNAEVVLTRTDDTFIPLEERTALANQHEADLFISIHANASHSRSATGVETYYLDFASTEDAQEVAARENATTVRNVRDLQDIVKWITRADKSAESRELASIVQKRLHGGAQQLFPFARNRGVRSAPFVVLIGANMPSVLAELGFISNPRDEKLLKKEDSRRRLAEALYAGIEGYMKTLGSYVAQTRSN